MGKRGPVPKSPAERRLTGSKRRITPTARQALKTLGPPVMPPDLPKAAAEEWQRIVPLLVQAEIVNVLDSRALGDLCLCWARLQECEADITRRGVMVKGERGLVKNPALQVARTYRDSLLRWCVEFGLTSSARGRLEIVEPPGPSLKQFLNLSDA